jgi:hypothetical protein
MISGSLFFYQNWLTFLLALWLSFLLTKANIFLSADRVFCDYNNYSAQRSRLSSRIAHELWIGFQVFPSAIYTGK